MLQKEMLSVNEIYDLFYKFGITAESSGFFHASYAIRLAMEEPDRLMFVTKWLYPDVANFYHTNWRAVERNIRRVAHIAWKNNPKLLCELAMHHQFSKPTAARFIAILAAYLTNTLPDFPAITDQAQIDLLDDHPSEEQSE